MTLQERIARSASRASVLHDLKQVGSKHEHRARGRQLAPSKTVKRDIRDAQGQDAHAMIEFRLIRDDLVGCLLDHLEQPTQAGPPIRLEPSPAAPGGDVLDGSYANLEQVCSVGVGEVEGCEGGREGCHRSSSKRCDGFIDRISEPPVSDLEPVEITVLVGQLFSPVINADSPPRSVAIRMIGEADFSVVDADIGAARLRGETELGAGHAISDRVGEIFGDGWKVREDHLGSPNRGRLSLPRKHVLPRKVGSVNRDFHIKEAE